MNIRPMFKNAHARGQIIGRLFVIKVVPAHRKLMSSMRYQYRINDRGPNRCAGSGLGLIFAGLILFILAPAVSSAQCPSDDGDCLEPHGAPGCTDLECCQLVCQTDQACCESWDGICAGLANTLCSGLCGADAAGSCFASNMTPSCSDETCCEQICVVDPFCCETMWDGNCAFLAGFSCEPKSGGECGDPASGACNDPNGIPACTDAECCELVCAQDPRCCDLTWDQICVAFADTFCNNDCLLSVPGTAIEATETCSTGNDDPCNGGEVDAMSCGDLYAGTFSSASDVDLVSLGLVDEDGDGEVRVRLTLTATRQAKVELLTGDDACKSPITTDLSVQGGNCLSYVSTLCVPAGQAWLRITPLETPSSCLGDIYHYMVRVECVDYCGEPCENPVGCLDVHGSPGCDDSECCDSVCENDPVCCEWTWDSFCTVSAATVCGGPAPANDSCSTPEMALDGNTPFRQLLSTPDSVVPTDCIPEGRATTGDVWFRHVVRCEGQLIFSTCSTADFDTVIEVYRGQCDALELVACNDNSGACGVNTSLIGIDDLECQEEILVRVSGVQGGTGSGVLNITCFGGDCGCTADLNQDGQVNGEDIGLFLALWGPEYSQGDLNGDGIVNGEDFGLLLAQWGNCL